MKQQRIETTTDYADDTDYLIWIGPQAADYEDLICENRKESVEWQNVAQPKSV